MKYLLVFISVIVSQSAYTIEYYCPQTPINVYLNEKIEANWIITPKIETTINTSDMYKKKYTIKYWRGLSGGDIKNYKLGFKFFIECCNLIKEYGFNICARRKIKEGECEAVIPRSKNENEYFICKDNEGS